MGKKTMEKLPQEKFKVNTSDFLVFCKEVLTEIKSKKAFDIDLTEIDALSQIVSLVDDNTLLKKFIESTYEYWEQIRKKDHEFFDKNIGTIFPGVNQEKIKVLKYIFVESSNDKEIRDLIWQYLHGFVKISILYIHNAKGPASEKVVETSGKNKIIKSWKNKEEYKQVKLIDLSKSWSVELIWPN